MKNERHSGNKNRLPHNPEKDSCFWLNLHLKRKEISEYCLPNDL